MTDKIFLSLEDINQRAKDVADLIVSYPGVSDVQYPTIYGIPRGGISAALAILIALREHNPSWAMTSIPEYATAFVDDIIDSGNTMQRYLKKHQRAIGGFALVDKLRNPYDKGWFVFPWEAKDGKDDEGIQENVKRLLQYIGEDPEREGLVETPARVEKAYREWFSGYGHEGYEVLKTFEDGAEKTDEMIVVGPISFYSHCEHHIAPFFGSVHIAYIPDGKIVGLSKFARLVEIYSRRLQVQERLTAQIAESLQEGLCPKGVAVLVKARHLCMESRGAKSIGSTTTTSKLLGAMKTSEARSEFLRLCA